MANKTHEDNTSQYKLRKANEEDLGLLFQWANDEEVRRNSINTQEIFPEEHTAWLNNKLASPQTEIFIFETCQKAVGQVRFDFNPTEKVWEIGYSVATEFRGMGLAKLMLNEAIRTHNQFPLSAYVKEENKRSKSTFDSLGFINKGICEIKNSMLIKYYKGAA